MKIWNKPIIQNQYKNATSCYCPLDDERAKRRNAQSGNTTCGTGETNERVRLDYMSLLQIFDQLHWLELKLIFFHAWCNQYPIYSRLKQFLMRSMTAKNSNKNHTFKRAVFGCPYQFIIDCSIICCWAFVPSRRFILEPMILWWNNI